MKLLPLLLSVALVAPASLSAGTFEGTVTMSIKTARSDSGLNEVNYSIKPGFFRIDVQGGAHGGGAMIMDENAQTMMILMPQQRMYMVQPINRPSENPNGTRPVGEHSFERTSEHETILGYDCVKYVVTSENGTAEIWVTDQLGTFMAFSGGMGRRPQAPQAWESALKGTNFFPMRIVSTGKAGETRIEVTSVEKKHLPDSDFQAPDGWRKFDMGGFGGGMFPGGIPGGRPPGY